MKTKIALMGLGLALMLAQPNASFAQTEAMTVQAAVDHVQIEDLLQRYYANFGKGEEDSFSSFYADDAEFVLGGKTYKGKDAIAGAYKAISAGASNPTAARFSFNVVLTNPVITVHGDTATAQMIFTEVVMDTPSAPPRLLTQGREYDHLVKVKGVWRFSKREVVAGANTPPGWVN